jgi:glycerol-3-phosphate acyltransferase PlsY
VPLPADNPGLTLLGPSSTPNPPPAERSHPTSPAPSRGGPTADGDSCAIPQTSGWFLHSAVVGVKLGRTTAAAGAGYLLGSVPIGVIVGRLAAGVDVRKYGSRVSGATNVLRAAGPAAAAATFGLDSAKGYMAARIGERIGGEEGGVVGAVAAALGHSWPLWAEFKGGRSVLTCWGSLIAMDRNAAAAAAIAGAGTVAATRYVSVGALTGVSVAAAATLLRSSARPAEARVFCLFALGFLAFRLRGNIGRLRRGEELRLGDQINAAKGGQVGASGS